MKRLISFLAFGCITLLVLFAGTCNNDSPVKPPPAPPDTTSHDYQFRLYEVGGINSVFYDVAALSPDFVIATGKFEGMGNSDHPTNAFMWDGLDLKPISLPINPHDTFTVNPPTSFRIVTNIWNFRRDHMWYSNDYGAAAELTITGKDTNVMNINYRKRSDIAPSFGGRIWAKDTSEIYFGNEQGIMYKYKSGTWTPITPATKGGRIDDLWGFNSQNIWITTTEYDSMNDTFQRFDGKNWSLLWHRTLPSLSDSVLFGAPRAIWGTNDDDSIWVSGLYLGRMKKDGTGKVKALRDITNGGVLRIRGSAKNNVFFVGYVGMILHYNGRSIKEYQNFVDPSIKFNSVATLENEVFIVGSKRWGGAIFVHGYKIK